MNWELAHWGRCLSTYGYETFLKGLFGQGAPDPKIVEEAGGFIARFGKVLDDHLAKKYLVGDKLSLREWRVAKASGSVRASRFPAHPPEGGLERFCGVGLHDVAVGGDHAVE